MLQEVRNYVELAPPRPVQVEVYAFRATPELAYRRVAGALGAAETPDAAVARLVGLDEAAAPLVHSTSWRPMPDGSVVLTYAVVPDPLPTAQATPLLDLDLATGEHPSRPTPPSVREDQVAAHAVRHLSFLLDTDPAAHQALTRDLALAELLSSVPHSLAGAIS